MSGNARKSLESSVCIAKENLTIFEQLRTIDTATFHNYYDNVPGFTGTVENPIFKKTDTH